MQCYFAGSFEYQSKAKHVNSFHYALQYPISVRVEVWNKNPFNDDFIDNVDFTFPKPSDTRRHTEHIRGVNQQAR